MTPMDRVIDRVTLDENGCWLAGDPRFYAQVMIDGKQYGAHRVSYEFFREPIPEGLAIDHLCRVKNCVNPWHLEPVTMRENVAARRHDSGSTREPHSLPSRARLERKR